MPKYERYFYYFIFFLVALSAFWQIAFYIHPVKHDMVDCFYPWRFFIGECLQEGKLPLWNPYQNLGYPISADPSSGAWYPIVWLFGYLFGYDLLILGWEYLFHIFFAGIGFFKLCSTLKFNGRISFIAALSYMLCGVFVGNAQHLTYIVSACWLPYILNYFLRSVEESTYLNPLKAAVFLFLMITGGYPAFTIILAYLLLVFVIVFSVRFFREGNSSKFRPFFFRNLFFVIFSLVLSSVLLFAVWQVSPHLTRTNVFTLSKALFAPFTPESFLSFILPFPTVKAPLVFNTDQSMANGYFGLIMLIAFILSLFIRKEREVRVFFYFGLFSLLAAVGEALPVRRLLFEYVPGMNLFRFPSVFRLFSILGFILAGATWLNLFLIKKRAVNLRHFKITVLILLSIILWILIIAATGDDIQFTFSGFSKLMDPSSKNALIQYVFCQAALQLILLSILLFILVRIRNKNAALRFITLLVVADLLFAAQLNAPYSVYSDVSARDADIHISQFPQGFPVPKDQRVAEVNPFEVYKVPFWKNVNIFQKQISAEGFNSFSLNKYETLRDQYPNIFKSTINNKLVFMADTVVSHSALAEYEKDTSLRNGMVFLHDDLLRKKDFQHTFGDTTYLIGFSPDSFKLTVRTADLNVLAVLQNNYRGWKAFIDGIELEPLEINIALLGLEIPPGEHVVILAYDNAWLKIFFFISSFAFLLSIGIIAYHKFGKRKRDDR